MAPGKKKKKPASNPARGFATTSIASKPKVEIAEPDPVPAPTESQGNAESNEKGIPENSALNPEASIASGNILSAEDFEKQLEESELQILVEKHAQKSKRDALRQKTRLETDRRVLRGQADNLITRRWLPPELMEEILDLVQTEGRFAGQANENAHAAKQVSEEELTVRLWTLQQALVGSGFREDKVILALRYVLDISDKIISGNKDSIWGMEESLDWLARECPRDCLPDYENWQRRGAMVSKSQTETPMDSPLPSGYSTPQAESDTRHLGHGTTRGPLPYPERQRSPAKRIVPIDDDSDIDPDDLLSVYLDCKSKLFEMERQRSKPGTNASNPRPKQTPSKSGTGQDLTRAKLDRKIKKIQDDVLFDQYIANQRWEAQRILLERDAAHRRAVEATPDVSDELAALADSDVDDEVSKEAARMGAELLEGNDSDDESALADLFASLPVNEVDPVTGKSITVVNGSNGVKVTIRDFGKWTGVSPTRVLEEACRARDSSAKIQMLLISDSSYSNRHSLKISWSKVQDLQPSAPPTSVDYSSTTKSQTFIMTSISAPEPKQSEAFIATTALFLLFSSSGKEDKVFLRLPAVWRDLWTEFAETKKGKADEADRNVIRRFRDMVRERRDRELEDGVLIQGAFKNRNGARPLENGEESGTDKANKSTLSPEAYQKIWIDKSSTPNFQMMLQSRMQLPMWHFKDEVLDTIEKHQVVIICGETGCGKSTQVPSFILEHQLSQGKACKIYCTEPRRISAISLARRVSEELGERKNDLGTPRSLIGYAIRLESNTSKETRLVYATTGIVMRMLEGSNDLRDITHIVLDEVHERTIDSDFLLIVLRKLMARRPDLKVVLMSATVDAERFSKYLDGAPVLSVPGRTFPVEVRYLEDAVELTGFNIDNGLHEKFQDLDDDDTEAADADLSDAAKAENTKALKGFSAKTRNTIAQIDEYRIEFELVTQLLAKIATDSRLEMYSQAILVFLPGIGEIRQLNDMLVGHPVFSSNWFVYPLHSTIASEDQEAAFLVPPPGTRKIVLATNIAETGITIPDVTCVVDTGKHREMRFDERRQLSRLLETFISKANAKQRRGRAGRVQEGLCFHLFTKYRHDELMPDQQTPELLRLSLQDLAIRVKICKLGGIEETLSQALDPPSAKNIRRAVDALIDVRALTPGEDLTPLGIQLARLPLDVFLGKLVLLGSIFKCLDAAVTIAAVLSSKSPFSAPFGARAQADTIRLAFRRGDSDLLTVYNAYLAWRRVCVTGGSEYQFCKKNFLSQQTLSSIEELKGQLVLCLVDSGFLPLTEAESISLNRSRYSSRRRQFFDIPQRANVNSDNDVITSSVIAWSFYPKLLVRDGKGFRNVANNQSISLHPSSVNKGHHELKWLSFYHIMQAKQFYNAHETTAAEEFAIALLCGDVRCDMYSGVFIIDGNRARFAVSDWKTMLVIKTLRSRLRDIMTRSFKTPGKALTSQQQKWMDVWQKIFSQEFKEK
ncbi:P-loop containing nucleoside triphosphate hydrolase protein [Mollisia scopiformis]|uniref:RNA helicase n=1 Tax=Mollisia scopiformis TaxID=149040 RepID=A0A194WWK9_MOLSC|nr:P-loop containing nucleoside triphosphate hydrolase protein [Mollisia scopiformis]KUJ11967.1 P-loop containing nucleoside triphosphate hydrolase protein [Mollisia scopiformis]